MAGPGRRGPPKGCPATPGAGRPKGSRNKSTADLQAIAQPYTAEAIGTYVRLMRDPEQPGAVQSGAATCLLDRGYGKPMQSIEQTNIGQPQFAIVVPQRAADEADWLNFAASAEAQSPDRRN